MISVLAVQQGSLFPSVVSEKALSFRKYFCAFSIVNSPAADPG
jgi:hypothetical protein